MYVVTWIDNRTNIKCVLMHYPWTDKKDQPIYYKNEAEASLGFNWIKETMPKYKYRDLKIEDENLRLHGNSI